MSGNRLLSRETLGDVLVNLVPLAVLGAFVTMFVVASPYRKAPVQTTVQISLVAIPAVVLLVLTYYALQAVEAADGELGGGVGAGYVDDGAETAPAADDD